MRADPLPDSATIEALVGTLDTASSDGVDFVSPNESLCEDHERWQIGGGAVKVREVIKLLRKDGWYLARTRGSHRQYKHSEKPGLVTVPGNMKDELAPGTLNSVLRQAGLKE